MCAAFAACQRPYKADSKKVAKPAKPDLKLQDSLDKDPSAYATLWKQNMISDLGKAKEITIRLRGLECQDALLDKIETSAATMEKIYQKVTGLGDEPPGNVLKKLLDDEGKPAACVSACDSSLRRECVT